MSTRIEKIRATTRAALKVSHDADDMEAARAIASEITGTAIERVETMNPLTMSAVLATMHMMRAELAPLTRYDTIVGDRGRAIAGSVVGVSVSGGTGGSALVEHESNGKTITVAGGQGGAR
jgi:hypothetical protein